MAAADLREAMELDVEKNLAKEKLKMAKAAVVLHLQHFSGVSSAGKAISGITKESEDLIKLIGKVEKEESENLIKLMRKVEKEDEHIKAVKNFDSKTSALVSKVSKASDAFRRWNNDSIDVFHDFTRASAEYRTLSTRFINIVKRLRQYDEVDVANTTTAQRAFVSKHVEKLIFLHHMW